LSASSRIFGILQLETTFKFGQLRI
jgi:hypothetical protein